MTLAGTRPPTVDEWEKYELHHRARLATKPGLTGMWQVSGRSNITDFEEVVELDREWEACGYDIKREKGEKYIELYRKPLKRFEDIDMSKSDGVTIISSEKDKYLNTVLNTIEKIRENNPTVLPDDIGIIFMENSNDNFELASKLQLLIREKYNWKVNIGYETKEKVEGTLFISNRNNVKGLEFPFVICIMQNALTYNYSIWLV